MTRTTIRLDFDKTRRLGPGKVALLEAIGRTGSISAAGREFGMAYRRAWLLVNTINQMFAQQVVVTREGGKNGGGASLTEFGQTIIQLYRDAERKIHLSAAAEIAALEQALAAKTAESSNQ